MEEGPRAGAVTEAGRTQPPAAAAAANMGEKPGWWGEDQIIFEKRVLARPPRMGPPGPFHKNENCH